VLDAVQVENLSLSRGQLLERALYVQVDLRRASRLERPIGMGYVESALDRPGGTLEVLAGGTRLNVRIAPRPFWTRGSRRS
jgi:hypothetical protein